MKFIVNMNNEHAQDYSCPGTTFVFCSHGEKLHRQGGLSGVVQRVTRLLGNKNSYEQLQVSDAKLTLGSVSCPEAMNCPGIM